MAEDQFEKMGFREWTNHYEKEQESDRAKLNDLTNAVGTINSIVGALSADVRTLLENQKGMHSRINRPWQWGVVVAVFVALFSMSGLFATILTLSINPIKASLVHIEEGMLGDESRQREIHLMLTGEMISGKVQNAVSQESLRWIEKLESRYDMQFGLSSGCSQDRSKPCAGMSNQ